MPKRNVYLFLPWILVFLPQLLIAQRLSGNVRSSVGIIPFASVTVRGSTIGTSANDKGRFSFHLEPGTYTIVCQHIGFAAQEKTITLQGDQEMEFVLQDQQFTMKEVVIKNTDEDPAYAIMRQAIRTREAHKREVTGFNCDMYGKDMIGLRNLPKKIFGQKIDSSDKKEMGLDSSGKGIIYLSESISRIHSRQPDKFKMEVVSSRVSGSGGFGFTFPTFISLYDENVKVFTEKLNPRGFISPLADGAIGYYKFKFLGSFWENGKEINAIRVTPRRLYEPLFSGVININEGDWHIHSMDLLVTKKSQLELLDTLQLKQLYVQTGHVWMVKNQLLHFSFNQFKFDALGNFLTVYSNYEVNPVFPPKFFDRIVIKYDTAVNKRSKAYWDTIRPVPLEKAEVKDYLVKDSLYQLNLDSALSRNAIDSLNKRQGRLKPWNIAWKPIVRAHYSKTQTVRWGAEPLLQHMEYNPAEGVVLNLRGFYQLNRIGKRTTLRFEPNLRYGFSNEHFNAWGNLVLNHRESLSGERARRFNIGFSGGKRVEQFNRESVLDPLVNSVSVLFYGDNFMKTYEEYFGSMQFNKRYDNGLRFSVQAMFEDRMPLLNTTRFTLYAKDSARITPNYPTEKLSADFTPHQAFTTTLSISFRPGQKYIQFPRYRASLGSKYPTFELAYTKGYDGIFGSDVDFDKWKVTIFDDKNLKLLGSLAYRMGAGGFLNARKLFIQDYQHFNGNRSLAATTYLQSFQLASYYANSTIASLYGFGHVEYHLNGLLTNKIPLFRKLNWHALAGSNAFYVNQRSNYAEVFVGLENIFKIFRVDFVAGYENGTKGRTGVRIGTGGFIGSSIRRNRGSGSVSVGL
jgi:hypothetical protein